MEQNRDISRILISEEELKNKVAEMGRRISQDYQGKRLMVVGVLKGSVVFMADLIRHITVPVEMDFMAVSSYGAGVKTIFYGLGSVGVKAGDKVKQGDDIGTTVSSTIVEVRIGDVAVEPLSVLRGECGALQVG